MSVVNPYAIPEANLDRSRNYSGGVWRVDRDKLYVTRGAELPDRCVKCNAPAKPAKSRTFYWHSPALYLLVLVSPLIYIIVAMLIRKKIDVAPRLCDDHDRRRVNNIWFSIGSLVGGIVLLVIAVNIDAPLVALLAVFGGLIACIVFGYRARILLPVDIDERGAKFKGCDPAFLASLEFNDRQ